MPRGDGTGPEGMGPMTGRAAGYCAGAGQPGFMSSGRGWGFGPGRGYGAGRHVGGGFAYGRGARPGRGMGYGRGFGWAAPAYGAGAPDPAMEAEVLKDQAEALSRQLDQIRSRLNDLEGSGETE